MTKEQFSFQYLKAINHYELSSEQLNLLENASNACHKAYAPYSKFYVGAALLLEDGKILTGVNQENASYPCGICAERAVLHEYGNQYSHIKISKIAITVSNRIHTTEYPIAPCGLCRQVLCEFELKNNAPIELILGQMNQACYVIERASFLLPFTFTMDFLVKPN